MTASGARARAYLLLGLHPHTRIPLEGGTAPDSGTTWPRGYEAALASAQASATQRRGTADVAAQHGAQPAAAPLLATPEPPWRAAIRVNLIERVSSDVGPSPKCRRVG